MSVLSESLIVSRCPHCAVAHPHLRRVHHLETDNHKFDNKRRWGIYVCGTCGSVVSAWAHNHGERVMGSYPDHPEIDEDIPDRPRAYLQQAMESLHAPAGAVMLAASAVDSMLKLRGYVDGSLYTRIEKAIGENVMTKDMGNWAHAVRLDANDQRHADAASDMPAEDDARRVIDFAQTLAELLFVLPTRVARGLGDKQ